MDPVGTFLAQEYALALQEQAKAALDNPKLPAHLKAYYHAKLREAQRLLGQGSDSQSFTVRL